MGGSINTEKPGNCTTLLQRRSGARPTLPLDMYNTANWEGRGGGGGGGAGKVSVGRLETEGARWHAPGLYLRHTTYSPTCLGGQGHCTVSAKARLV